MLVEASQVERSVQSRTPILLKFLVGLPSVGLTGRWRSGGGCETGDLERDGGCNSSPTSEPRRQWDPGGTSGEMKLPATFGVANYAPGLPSPRKTEDVAGKIARM